MAVNAWKYKVDVILNPKFSTPLISRKKSIIVQHGADWFVPEYAKFYKKIDVLYNRLFIPLYCRKASTVISVSKFSTDDFVKYVKVPREKMKTVYFGPAEYFKPVDDKGVIDKVRLKYSLPEKFIFTLSKYGAGGGLRKNIDKIFKAYQIYFDHAEKPLKLVVGGKNVEKYINDLAVPSGGYRENIQFAGWIEQEDLPALYSMAALYLYPSNLETFPIPITEAMACGTPIVTSKINGLKEIAGEAALFVDHQNPAAIADAVRLVLADRQLEKSLSAKGLERSSLFSWKKCASEILELMENLATQADAC
jgi:glycosyltransferase involved in cell wall biosynthesis